MMSISEKKISGVEKCPGRETENLICLYAEWDKIRGESNIIHAVCQKKVQHEYVLSRMAIVNILFVAPFPFLTHYVLVVCIGECVIV